jgi:hypothetical protein
MKSKTLPIGTLAAAIAIVIATISVLVLNADVTSAQSARKLGSTIQKCYTTDGRNVPCDRLDAENKKAKAAKDKTK